MPLAGPAQAPTSELPQGRYVPSGDVNIAYQIVGDGARRPGFVPGFISNLESARCLLYPTLLSVERPSLASLRGSPSRRHASETARRTSSSQAVNTGLERSEPDPISCSFGSMIPRLSTILKLPLLAWAMYMFIRT
jgi:hypothetical protein